MNIKFLVHGYYKECTRNEPICSIQLLITQFYVDHNSDNFDIKSIINPNKLCITNINKYIKYIAFRNQMYESNECHIKFQNVLQKNKIYVYSFDINYRNKPLYIGLVVNNAYQYFSDKWYAASDTGFALDLDSGEFVTYIACFQPLSPTLYISSKDKQEHQINDQQNNQIKLVINRQNESVRYIVNDYNGGIAYHLNKKLTYSVAVCLTTIQQIIRLNYSEQIDVDNANLTKHDEDVIATNCYWQKLQKQHW